MTDPTGGLESFYREHIGQESSDFRFVALKEFLRGQLQGDSVADIGCGTGTMIRELSRSGLRVAGFEPAPEIFALAQGLQKESRLPYPLFNLGVDGMKPDHLASFRNVLLIDVLEHLEDDHAALKGIHGLMPEGAQLLCLVPAVAALYGRRDRQVGHFRRYDQKDIEALFASCPFRRLEVRHWNLLGVPAYWLFEKLLRVQMPEGFRMKQATGFDKVLNSVLLQWFRGVENRVPFPFGLSLLVKAVK